MKRKDISKWYGNKNAEKWTEEEALKLAENLLDWLFVDENIFVNLFLAMKGLNKDTADYLVKKFVSFSEQIKIAKFIQEWKLQELGCKGALNPALVIFCLKNNHGYKDRQEIKQESVVLNFDKDDKHL